MSFSADAGSAIAVVQAALYREIVNALIVPELANALYDYVPENAAPPYLSIGDWTETRKATTQSTYGSELTCSMHVWARGTSRLPCLNICDAVIKLLERRELAGLGDGWSWEDTYLDFHQVIRDPDGLTWHAILRWRIRARKQAL